MLAQSAWPWLEWFDAENSFVLLFARMETPLSEEGYSLLGQGLHAFAG